MFFTENQAYGNMLNIKPQTIPNTDFYNYLWTGSKFHPENGWELLLVNLGRYPDDESINEFEEQKFTPYVVIYNKYKGIIRVFVAYGRNQIPISAIDGVQINLEFTQSYLNHIEKNEYSGLLRLGEGMDKSLDQETTVRKMTAVAKNPGTENRWYSVDFQIAYDPCTCLYPSRLALKFNFFSHTDFRLIGNSLTQNDIDMTAANVLINQDFLGNLEIDSDGNASNGFIIYENLSFVIDDYLKQLQKYEDDLAAVQQENKRIKRNKAIAKAFKAVILGSVSPSYLAAEAVSIAAAIADQEQWAGDMLDGAKDLLDGDSLKLFKLSDEMKKLIGGQFDFFIDKAFEEKVKPTSPSMPSISYSQMSFAGQLRDEFFVGGVDFMMPGTFHDPINYDAINDPLIFSYPVYNEVLGVFALLEKPKLKIYESLEDKSCTFLQEDHLAAAELRFNHVFQFALDGDLKYVFNQTLSIENFDIQTSFDIHASRKSGELINSINGQPWKITNNHSKSVNIESNTYGIDEPMTVLPEAVRINSSYVPIDAINSFTGGFGNHYVFGQSGIGSGEVFCEGLELLEVKDFAHIAIDSIYLKLLINVTYEGEDSDGNLHEYTYVFSYKIDPDDIDDSFTSPLYPNLPGSPADITQYPENLFLDGINFDGSQIENCTLNGTIYNCKAWNDITLSGDFTVSSGYKVFIEAGNEIITVPESIISPEMIRQIVPVLDYSNPMPPVDETYVDDFCKSNGAYKARTSNMPLFNNDSTIVYEEDVRDIFAFNIFPNPTSGSSAVSITLNESAKGELFITDMNGRTLATAFSGRALRAGQTEHQLPTASLASGIYLVHLFVDGERHVKRLVKQ